MSLVTNKLTPSVTRGAPFHPLHREGIKVIRFGPLIGNPCNLKRNRLLRRKGGRGVLSRRRYIPKDFCVAEIEAGAGSVND